jgi:hypothetical protein
MPLTPGLMKITLEITSYLDEWRKRQERDSRRLRRILTSILTLYSQLKIKCII